MNRKKLFDFIEKYDYSDIRKKALTLLSETELKSSSIITLELNIFKNNDDNYCYSNTIFDIVTMSKNNPQKVNKFIEENAAQICNFKTFEIDDIYYIDSKKNVDLRNSQTIVENTVSIYVCSNCKAKKNIIKSVQLRAGDEETNISVTCANCRKTWTI